MLAVLYYGVDADWFVQINVKTCELCILLPISTKNEILACTTPNLEQLGSIDRIRDQPDRF